MDLKPKLEEYSGEIYRIEEPQFVRARVFDIQRFVLHDGPGIRTLVFLKGCSLSCLWCGNPEGISPEPELGVFKVRCNKCGKCVPACPEGAISLDIEGKAQVDHQRCTGCGECVKVCPEKALVFYGREMTAAEVIEEVIRDKAFYEGSGGGVTLSGGEPLRQPRFVKAIGQLCREAGIHTAIETCGLVSSQVLREILPLLDYILYDLKHLNPSRHKQFTGMPNQLILENARLAASSGVPVLFRSPLIPGVNDDLENIQATATFLKEIQGSDAAFEFLPYHRLGLAKYKALDKPYCFEPESLDRDSPLVKAVQQSYENLGVKCSIS